MNYGTLLLILVLAIMSCRHATTRQVAMSPDSSGMFVAACQVAPDDPEFRRAQSLALVHAPGTTSSILYQVTRGTEFYVAELHYASAQNREFIDAQGGMRSNAVASDVIASLTQAPFFYVRDWRSAVGRDPRFSEPCHIAYDATRRYDQPR